MSDARRAAERTPDEVLAEVAQDREQLLAALNAAGAKPGAKCDVESVKSRWQVYLQSPRGTEYLTCTHRWGWVAELCARRRERHAAELAVRYVARRAES
jgi:hypothetical protein